MTHIPKNHHHTVPLILLSLLLLLEATSPDSIESPLWQTQQQIAAQVLRFHIRANSDTLEDQQKKLQIKQDLLTWMNTHLQSCNTRQETIRAIQAHLPELTREAGRLAAPDTATVFLQEEWFPEKTYGTCTFPEGTYQALCVNIGEGKGHNWWCVLYPALCYQDVLEPTMTEAGEEKLLQVLDEDACDLLLHPQKLKIRFRLEFFLRNR